MLLIGCGRSAFPALLALRDPLRRPGYGETAAGGDPPTLDNITNLIQLSGTGGLRARSRGGSDAAHVAWFVNTLLLALISTGIHVSSDTMAAMPLPSASSRLQCALLADLVASFMIPGQVTLVPLHLMITQFAGQHLCRRASMGLADVIGIFLLSSTSRPCPPSR